MASRTRSESITFDALKQSDCKHVGTTPDTADGVKRMKGMRAYIRANRADLVKAGWKALADHQKGAAYGDVPRSVASLIVARKRLGE